MFFFQHDIEHMTCSSQFVHLEKFPDVHFRLSKHEYTKAYLDEAKCKRQEGRVKDCMMVDVQVDPR